MSRIHPVSAAIAIFAVGLNSGLAQADESNPNYLPFGERAAFLGNAGITSDRGEAVYYNPANLARVGHPNLSVSGNLYVRFELEADPLLVIAGEDVPFEATGFMSIPSTLVSTYRIGTWYLGSAVLIPDAFALKNRVPLEGPILEGTMLQSSQEQSLWVGGGAAREVAAGVWAGLSVFAANETESQISFLRFSAVSDPAVVTETMSNVDLSVWNLVAIAGLQWQASPRLAVGVRTRLPPLKLTGSADIYQTVLATGGEEDVAIEQTFEDVDVSRPLPWDVGAGLSFRVGDRLELVADLNFQLPATLTKLDDEELGVERVEVDLTPRVGVGADWRVGSSLWLRLGSLYNGSAYSAPRSSADPPKEVYYGVTGGLAWQKDRTQTALGGFFLQSTVDLLVDGSDPARKSDARGSLYGAMLTVSYRL